MADREDPAMDPVQSAAGDPIPNGSRAESECDQLPQSDDAVLTCGHECDLGIDRVNPLFRRQDCRDVGFTGHGSRMAAGGARMVRRRCRVRNECVPFSALPLGVTVMG